MRTKIVAGNWKMNLNRDESLQLILDISTAIQQHDLKGNRVMVFPPFVTIGYVMDSGNRDHRIEVGAQNMHQEESGAYTGEVAAKMLSNMGVNSVILGHSERREYFNETDSLLKQKVDTARSNGLEVVFCFGEKLDERNAGNHFDVVERQLGEALFHLPGDAFETIVLAYEPVWAIGTGMTATPDQAQEMHAFIRKTLANRYSESLSNKVSILYGGSVKPDNATEIFGKPDVDGGLIGGASLKANDFVAIVKAL
ncbi:MAG TPA: triose-phosphate isomerase [Flavobacteriaceae bacterium]|nr:triose-phosphate isomerase [Flavobacteriaceae bacterium]MCB9213629.1 triose-phosphate isomerase [Alteromonas sp.]HPF12130.1 triose-phosphate isomerase [Flavobacteriaceae bacterium]HQU22620.1 triose-phosphate isomerase [Flavobacteriaceae bacterium]HQU65589.1 triose-phosphate isomerase [Flavobacteriaceae bacterium]